MVIRLGNDMSEETEATKETPNYDQALEALDAIVKVLEPLEMETQLRVVKAACVVLGH